MLQWWFAVTIALRSFVDGCVSDLDCSLNGACVASQCQCDAGWDGGSCEVLRLLPASFHDGYNHLRQGNLSVSSWGASQAKGDDGLYHTFVGEMTHHCGIDSYETNEQIVHATSGSQQGPWTRIGPIHPFTITAVCPHVLRTPPTCKQDGSQWLIFHTGCGNHSDPASEPRPAITDCANGSTHHHGRHPSLGRSRSRRHVPYNTQCGYASDAASVFYSSSPYGPWKQKLLRVGHPTRFVNGVPWPSCGGHQCDGPRHVEGNPTALILPNGTTLVIFRTYYKNETNCTALGAIIREGSGYPGCTLLGLARAERWDALYEVVGGPIVPFQQEDPFIYRNSRGYHAITHGMDPWPSAVHVGRHLYSVDGLKWYGGDIDCFNASVQISVGKDAGVVALARRERPELLRDDQGHPTALISAASFGSFGDQSFTMVQLVDQGDAPQFV